MSRRSLLAMAYRGQTISSMSPQTLRQHMGQIEDPLSHESVWPRDKNGACMQLSLYMACHYLHASAWLKCSESRAGVVVRCASF